MKSKVGKNDWYTITILCSKCQTSLYKYKKEGGGELIKCYISNILEDYTKGNLCCPNCGQQFAREAIVHNRPAHKIIGGKVIIRGHHGKSK